MAEVKLPQACIFTTKAVSVSAVYEVLQNRTQIHIHEEETLLGHDEKSFLSHSVCGATDDHGLTNALPKIYDDMQILRFVKWHENKPITKRV